MSILSHRVKSDLNNCKDDAQQTSTDISKEFKSFLTDVDDWFKTSTSLSGDELAKAKSKLSQRIQVAKERVGDASGSLGQQAYKTAAATNHYVHEQPWTVIGAGAAISFLLGILLAPRNNH